MLSKDIVMIMVTPLCIPGWKHCYRRGSDTARVGWIVLFNSLAPRKFWWNFRHAIFKRILVIDDWGISCELALIYVIGLHWWSVVQVMTLAVRQQAITWTNVDPDLGRRMVSLGHNELTLISPGSVDPTGILMLATTNCRLYCNISAIQNKVVL